MIKASSLALWDQNPHALLGMIFARLLRPSGKWARSPKPVQDEWPIVPQQLGDALRRREPRARWVPQRAGLGRTDINDAGSGKMKAEFNGGTSGDGAVCRSYRAMQGQFDPSGTRLGGARALPGRAVDGARH